MIGRLLASASLIAGLAALPAPAQAQDLSLENAFRIGSGGVTCNAQSSNRDPLLKSMFDRGYSIVCRDAASAVGKLYAFRGKDASIPAEQLIPGASCGAATSVSIPDMPGASRTECSSGDSGIAYAVYSVSARGRTFIASGLAGYDSALRLGLRSLVLDKRVPGDVEVAVTESGDAAAFARVQAGNLDPGEALAEGYTRNNEGSFAESAEFFETLVTRSTSGQSGFDRAAEYYGNQALQQSNMGNFAQSDRLFAQAVASADRADPLIVRLLRNFQAIDKLNQKDPAGALAMLSATLPAVANPATLGRSLTQGVIDQPLAQRLNIDDNEMVRLGGVSSQLTVPERAALLDAQSEYLRAAALRLSGDGAGAREALAAARSGLGSVRGGQVVSMRWLDAALLTERAAIDEAEGKTADAREALDQAVAINTANYPSSASLLASRARLAAHMARNGESEAAIDIFRDVVAKSGSTPGGGLVTSRMLRPYLDALTTDPAAGARNASDYFAASQTLVRPGVAQTQAVFARELSGGSDEAAALFRQSVNLSREIVRADANIERLRLTVAEDPLARDAIASETARRNALSQEQTAVVARLSAFPKYRVLSSSQLDLTALQANLKAGEAYFKISLAGGAAYAMLATKDSATAYRLQATPEDISEMVTALRETISAERDGQLQTSAFDVALSYQLYQILFSPVEATLRASTHLIYEPDGALLTLPANLLVTDLESVQAYERRQGMAGADPFDFRGTAWLGRDRMVTTAVSAQAFVDVRTIRPSQAKRRYLGLGSNALVSPSRRIAARDGCDWPLAVWDKPIDPGELKLASSLLGGAGNEVITDAAFTDDRLTARNDLSDFRVLHFATHGLVTAPAEQCPARPALVTSFGGKESDGLLSFKEIFDLRLDADTIILSACDTAGAATVDASREAGIATGGNFALDGLVRAFVGAGARAVVASHWPVPDDYNATQRLMSQVFRAGDGLGLAEAMRQSQLKLMDDADTSHPYYWSGFAIIGDGAKPLIGDI